MRNVEGKEKGIIKGGGGVKKRGVECLRKIRET